MSRFALLDTYSIDGREPGPGDAYELRGAWCSCCQSAREWDEYAEDLTRCDHEQLAADITPAELALDRELSRAMSRARIAAEALAIVKGDVR